MSRPTKATISLAALRDNYALAKRTAPRSKVLAVVKANAYGHGLERVARALASADGFGLVELEGAVALRGRGIKAPIVLLEGFFEASELDEIAGRGLATVVHCEDQLGIALYGATPFADRSAAALGVRPAMTLASRIIAIQDLQPGASVGYGGTFRAERPMRVGVVACGYADGYPRHAPSGSPILVDGVRVNTAGRVSMDMITVDLSLVPDARVGTPVVMWGDGIPIDEVATASGTVGYELMCALAPRVAIEEVS